MNVPKIYCNQFTNHATANEDVQGFFKRYPKAVIIDFKVYYRPDKNHQFPLTVVAIYHEKNVSDPIIRKKPKREYIIQPDNVPWDGSTKFF